MSGRTLERRACARFALVAYLAVAAPGAQAQSPSLAGDWQIGASVVTISQTGDRVRAVWKKPSEGCKAGALWWDGEVKDAQIIGQRYPCAGGVLQEALTVDIVDGGAALNVQIPAIGGTTLLTPLK